MFRHFLPDFLRKEDECRNRWYYISHKVWHAVNQTRSLAFESCLQPNTSGSVVPRLIGRGSLGNRHTPTGHWVSTVPLSTETPPSHRHDILKGIKKDVIYSVYSLSTVLRVEISAQWSCVTRLGIPGTFPV